MSNNHRTQHVVDNLFVFLLFTIFAVCSIFLIAFGANIYKKTISNFDRHYNLTTSVAYVQEKFRQLDRSDCCVVIPFGDSDALRFSEDINGTEYYTYIYEYDGFLKELHTKADNSLAPKAGQNLLDIHYLGISELTPGQFGITITDCNLDTVTFNCTSKSMYTN